MKIALHEWCAIRLWDYGLLQYSHDLMALARLHRLSGPVLLAHTPVECSTPETINRSGMHPTPFRGFRMGQRNAQTQTEVLKMAKRKSLSSNERLAVIGAMTAAGLGFVAMVWFAVFAPDGTNKLGAGDYRLETTSGQPFTQATLTGAPSVVFFGYTHCPDVCPTTLGDIAVWQHDLGDEAEKLRVFLVTVDPERDTLPMMAEYLSWTDGVIGVTGSRVEIDKVLNAFGIYARKVTAKGEHAHTVDHTASITLFDEQGRYTGKIAYQEPVETALSKLRALITSQN